MAQDRRCQLWFSSIVAAFLIATCACLGAASAEETAAEEPSAPPTEEAATVRAELAQFDPPNAAHFWTAISPYVDPAHHAHLREGLDRPVFSA